MDYSEAYARTLKAYQQQGVSYLQTIQNIPPPQIHTFAQLIPTNGKILDVGCAGGRDSKIFTDKGFTVTGIDVVDVFLAEAKKAVPEAHFQHVDIRTINFPSNSFDGIWAYAVLLHMQKNDLPVIFDSFYKLLKPHGKLFVGVKQGRGTAFTTGTLSTEKRFFTYFTEVELETLFINHGFQVQTLEIAPDQAGRTDTTWILATGTKV